MIIDQPRLRRAHHLLHRPSLQPRRRGPHRPLQLPVLHRHVLGARSLLLTRGAAHKRIHSLTLTRLGYPASPPLLAHIDSLVLATMR
uniref:Uncharacterized protein n=1 Tax=Oryza brachyantha TaxID=4533 RepID=J3M4P9_ORYBR